MPVPARSAARSASCRAYVTVSSCGGIAFQAQPHSWRAAGTLQQSRLQMAPCRHVLPEPPRLRACDRLLPAAAFLGGWGNAERCVCRERL